MARQGHRVGLVTSEDCVMAWWPVSHEGSMRWAAQWANNMGGRAWGQRLGIAAGWVARRKADCLGINHDGYGEATAHRAATPVADQDLAPPASASVGANDDPAGGSIRVGHAVETTHTAQHKNQRFLVSWSLSPRRFSYEKRFLLFSSLSSLN